MLPMKYIIFPFIVAISLISCNNSHSGHWATLSQVDYIIEEYPDSALKVLERMEPTELSGKEEKAKYALLLSMALDKNFVDRTDFEVLQPAIDYYADNGTPTEKLRLYLYMGKIYRNQGSYALAMESLVKAIAEGEDSDDLRAKARAYYAQSEINYSYLGWDEFVETNKQAANLYKEAGMLDDYAYCLVRIINGYTLNRDPQNALVYIEACKRTLSSVSLDVLTGYYSVKLTYLINWGEEQAILEAIKEYQDAVPPSRVDWPTVANAYLNVKKYHEGLAALTEYENCKDLDKDRRSLILFSELYQNLGEYEKSLEYYQKYSERATQEDSVELAVRMQGVRFVRERYELELNAFKERASKNRMLLWSVVFIVVLSAVIINIRYKLKVNRMEKTIAQQEAEKYRQLYQQMEEERDNLTQLLGQGDEMAPDVKKAVGKRLELLNKFFAAYIASNSDLDRKANMEMEELLANKDAFMMSTKYAFSGSHPQFIRYLEERGLSDWEICYCCLYALGLKGKEVGTYIQMRSHYNNSSEIREKLGISEHDTNLGIYIRKLLRSFE